MKKNLPLYILLLFLIIVNAFFLYNYLGIAKSEDTLKERKPPSNFLVKQLDFDESQRETFRALNRKHHRRMRGISDEIRQLKDVFFNGLSDASLTIDVDSLAVLMGELEAKKELEVYHHFKQVQELCNTEQQKKFSKIIKDALKKGPRDLEPPRGNGPKGDRPPRPRPNDTPGDGLPPPPPH